MSAVTDLITEIIVREGGDKFTDRPSDRGGPTKFGIDQRTLTAYRGRPATIDDVKNLTENEARSIYFKNYVSPFVSLADPVQAAVADFCVTSGEAHAVKALQTTLHLQPDGVLGPVTEKVANSTDARTLVNAFSVERAKFYARIVGSDHSQIPNLDGWLNRSLSFIR